MSANKIDKFTDRLSKAEAAKAAMLARFKARPGPDDPAVIARRAEMAAIEEAREKRLAERKAAKEAAAREAEEAARAWIERRKAARTAAKLPRQG